MNYSMNPQVRPPRGILERYKPPQIRLQILREWPVA